MLTRIAPSFAVANWVTTHSMQFGDQIPILSPFRMPDSYSPRATVSISSLSSRHVIRMPLCGTIKAGRSAQASTVFLSTSGTVSYQRPESDLPFT